MRPFSLYCWFKKGSCQLMETITVDSRYLEVQGTLWNTSRYPYLDISDLQNIKKKKKKKKKSTTFKKWICNLTLKIRDVLKILWKRGEIAPQEQFLLFSTIFCYLLLDFHIKTRTRFLLRDKRLFEISEVEITGFHCMCKKCWLSTS